MKRLKLPTAPPLVAGHVIEDLDDDQTRYRVLAIDKHNRTALMQPEIMEYGTWQMLPGRLVTAPLHRMRDRLEPGPWVAVFEIRGV